MQTEDDKRSGKGLSPITREEMTDLLRKHNALEEHGIPLEEWRAADIKRQCGDYYRSLKVKRT